MDGYSPAAAPATLTNFHIKPEETIWYPDADRDGDFSYWRQRFDDRLGLYCQSSNKFDGPAVESSFGKGVWDSTYSDDGYMKLDRVLDTGDLSPYLTSKAGWLTVVVLGILFLIAAIFFAFALRQKFRNAMARHFRNRCIDRQRVPLADVGSTRMTILGAFIVALLVALSICELYASARIKMAIDAVACDFWRTSKGHFFGALELDRQQLTDNDIVHDWKGTVAQHQAMKELGAKVNASNPQNWARVTVENHYFKLRDALTESMLHVVDEISETSSAIDLLALLGTFSYDSKWPQGDRLSGSSPVKCVFCEMAKVQIDTYAVDLASTTYDGINLFEANLALQLNTNSSMLGASYDTATTGGQSLLDVDIMMAKLLMVWDIKIAPMVFPAIAVTVVFGCLHGVCAMLLALTILVLSFVLLRNKKRGTHVKKAITISWGLVYIGVMLLGATGLILAGVSFLVGSIGGDACNFMDKQLFDEGKWKALPTIVWNTTYTKKTNLPTILDACMKSSGDGDVTAATGLSLLMARLEDGVSHTERELTSKVAEALDLKVKNEKTAMLRALLYDLAGVVALVSRPSAVYDPAVNTYVSFSKDYVTKFLCIYPMLGSPLDPQSMVTGCAANGGIASTVTRSNMTKALNDKFAEVLSPLLTFNGLVYYTGLCSELHPDDCKEGDWLVPEATKLRCTDNTQDSIFVQVCSDLKDSFDPFLADFRTLEVHWAFGNQVTINHRIASDSGFEAKWSEAVGRYNARRAKNGKQPCQHCENREATMGNLIEELGSNAKALGELLWDNFELTNSRINNFVLNETIGTFQHLLADSSANLENFNCQFIGTSMQNGMQKALCGAAFPSMSASGLITILIWATCFVGTFWSWRLFHYLRDLEMFVPNSDPKFEAISKATPAEYGKKPEM